MNEATPNLFNYFNFQTFPFFYFFTLLLEFSSNKKAKNTGREWTKGQRLACCQQLGGCNCNAGGDMIGVYGWVVMQLTASRVPVSPPGWGLSGLGQKQLQKCVGACIRHQEKQNSQLYSSSHLISNLHPPSSTISELKHPKPPHRLACSDRSRV